MTDTPNQDGESEIATCREIADRCMFIIGYARSSTTIVQNIVNTAPSTLVLGEAEFHQQTGIKDFRGWYNAKHVSFDNQITKSTYAPDLLPRPGPWWLWLRAALDHYACVGEKVALSAYGLAQRDLETIRSFYEQRFFRARFVFLMRSPDQALLSAMRLFGIRDPSAMRAEIDAWLQVVELWADLVRTLPNTLTLVTDNLDEAAVAELGKFVGQPIEPGRALLNPEQRRRHVVAKDLALPTEIVGGLRAVFEEVVAALRTPPVLWQATQKRTLSANDTRHDHVAATILAPRPLGQAWALARHLRGQIREYG